MIGITVQLSVAAGIKASAAVIPEVLLHWSVAFSELAAVVITGAVMSFTVKDLVADEVLLQASVAVKVTIMG
jgi:hypothetical protein